MAYRGNKKTISPEVKRSSRPSLLSDWILIGGPMIYIDQFLSRAPHTSPQTHVKNESGLATTPDRVMDVMCFSPVSSATL